MVSGIRKREKTKNPSDLQNTFLILPAKSLVPAFSKLGAVELLGFTAGLALCFGQLLKIAAFLRTAGIVFGPAVGALDKQDVAVFVGAVGMIVVGRAALVAAGDNGIADPLAQPLIEYEIFTDKLVGQTLCLHLPGVFDDAAFELENILKTLVLQVSAGFFAADAAGAVHHDVFVFLICQEFRHVGQFLAESIHIGCNSAFEMADFAFVMVAHINQDGIGRIGEGVEFFSLEVGAAIGGVEIGVVDPIGYYFWAQFDDEGKEGFAVVFDRDVEPQALKKQDVVHGRFEGLELCFGYGNLCVHTFAGHVDAAEHAQFVEHPVQMVAEELRIFEGDVFVKGNSSALFGTLLELLLQRASADAVVEKFFHVVVAPVSVCSADGLGAKVGICYFCIKLNHFIYQSSTNVNSQ